MPYLQDVGVALFTLQERLSQSVLLHFRQDDISQNLVETSLSQWA